MQMSVCVRVGVCVMGYAKNHLFYFYYVPQDIDTEMFPWLPFML